MADQTKTVTWEILDTSGYDSDGCVLLNGDDQDFESWLAKGIDPRKEKGFHWLPGTAS